VTWAEYGEGLAERLVTLHDRLHGGTYRARPSKRAWIPKGDGKKRLIGIAALEDKIVQQALVEVLQAIYEEDFLNFSYGSRPGRSQHNALDALYVAITQRKVSWVLDADIRGFFDSRLRALRRRSQKGRNLPWQRMQGWMEKWIPRARVRHPYPNQRLCV